LTPVVGERRLLEEVSPEGEVDRDAAGASLAGWSQVQVLSWAQVQSLSREAGVV
jgi:hypothetical protein